MRYAFLFVLAVAGAACSAAPIAPTDSEPIPPMSVSEFQALLESSDKPLVVNVWASWCVPCRSEAPLLRSAHAEFGDRVRFVGIDIRDSQAGGSAFIGEFGITYENYFDPEGAIPADLGGFGVPLTYFFAAGGERVFVQSGVIDDRTLALQIDELLARP